MAYDVNFSSDSPGFLQDSSLTDPDNYSSTSGISEELHIGLSPRPKLPFGLLGPSYLKSQPLDSAQKSSVPSFAVSYPHQAERQVPARDRDRWYHVGDDKSLDEDQGSYYSSLSGGEQAKVDARNASERLQHGTKQFLELEKQQSSLLAVLSQIRSKLSQTRTLRQAKDKASQEFMAAAEALASSHPQLQVLQELYASLQHSHMQYQEAEEQLESIVDEYQHARQVQGSEPELRIESTSEVESESDLNLQSDKGQIRPSVDEEGDGGRNPNRTGDSDMALKGISGERPGAIFPLYQKLQRVFGELQLARELLVHTQAKREALCAQKTQPLMGETLELLESYGEAGRRKALEMREMTIITEEERELLELYDGLEKTARQRIETYTDQFKSLRQQCKEEGVLPSHSPFQDERFGFDIFYFDEIALPYGPPGPRGFGPQGPPGPPIHSRSNGQYPTLAHPVFPLLLSNPSHILYDFPMTAVQLVSVALQLPPEEGFRERLIKEAAHEAGMQSLLSRIEPKDKKDAVNYWLMHKLYQSTMEVQLLWTIFHARLSVLDVEGWQRDVLYHWWRDDIPSLESAAVVTSYGTAGAEVEYNESADSGVAFDTFPYSDSGQLDRIRDWTLDDWE
ncbi:hypothetical protein GGS20DRAFT_558927 [Poronia punctata]|nr:hypothetical protein GGS20DRAFT_558927 [Poronia punctata]